MAINLHELSKIIYGNSWLLVAIRVEIKLGRARHKWVAGGRWMVVGAASEGLLKRPLVG